MTRRIDQTVRFRLVEGDAGWAWTVTWTGTRWGGLAESKERACEEVRRRINSLACSAAFADNEPTEAACAAALMRLASA